MLVVKHELNKTQLRAGNNKMLDAIQKHFNAKNDAHLCRLLDVGPPQISKMRSGIFAPTDAFLVRAHEATGLTIYALKSMVGLETYSPQGD